jgi:methionine transaminase
MNIKLPETQGKLFWEARKAALETNAIDMSVGMTEFNCPNKLAELASTYIYDNVNNYSPPEGILPLREKVSESMATRYGAKYNPDNEITICGGLVQAATAVISTLIDEGDEVIVTDPSYFTYSQAIRLSGGMPVYVPLKAPGFKIDWDDMRKMISSKTRLIIINSPNNPTGYVFDRDDFMELQRLVSSTSINILSDEGFEHLVYDQRKHQSIAQYPKLASRSFIISSPGPVFHINGWSLAWCIAPEKLMTEFRKVHETIAFSVATPLQHALASYWDQSDEMEDITEFYQGKRNYFNRLLKGTPFLIEPAQGTYFQLIGYKALSEEADVQFSRRLIAEAGVAAMPLSLFMHKKTNQHYLRFCFAKKNETLEEVASRLTKFAGKV